MGSGNLDRLVTVLPFGNLTFDVMATVRSSATGTLVNTASITPPASFTDPVETNNSDTDSINLIPTADLSLAKSVIPAGVVTPGATLFYILEIANPGPSDAIGVTVTDDLPPEVNWVQTTIIGDLIFDDSFETGDISSWSDPDPVAQDCGMPIDGTVTCDLGTLESGRNILVLIEVEVDSTAVGTLTNLAEVTSETSDPDSINNFDTVDTTVELGDADVGVSIDDEPDPVAVGATLTYTLTVTNAGPAPATGVTLVDSLPPEILSPSVTTPPAGCTVDVNVVTCDLGILAVGGGDVVVIRGTVGLGAFPALTNPANVSADQFDPDLSNNTDTETTTVTP